MDTAGTSAWGTARLGDRLVVAGLALALALTPAVFLPQLYDDFTLLKQASLLAAAACVLAGLALAGTPVAAGRTVAAGLTFWCAALLASELLAADPRGSLLGVYQYRQGLLTQAAYVVLFLGALHAASTGTRLAPLRFLAVGLGACLAYTALQTSGLDPVDWWLDTSERAIGTIGNANELAAFAVVSLVLCGALETAGRPRLAVLAAVPAAVSFIVFESESRSGLVALALFAALVPPAWWLARAPWRELWLPGAVAAGGFLAGALLSLAAGGLEGTTGRLGSGVSDSQAGGSTRLALWEGTIEVVKAEPLFGVGPDSLYLAFPVHRPAALGGAFEQYDLVAQSSHNLLLDTLANYGLAGAGGFILLVVASATAAVRRLRAADADQGGRLREPWTWAALGAYGALTLLNPISLAAHAVFFVTLGLLAGREPPPTPALAQMRPIATIAAAPAVAAALAVAVLLPLADLRADDAWDAYAAERFDSAAANYADAKRLMPLERRYATDHARSLLAAGVDGPASRLQEADRAYEELDHDFGLTAGDAIGQATARIGLEAPPSEVTPLIDRALALNPYGVAMASYTARLRLAAEGAAVLRYSHTDRWVYVEVALAQE